MLYAGRPQISSRIGQTYQQYRNCSAAVENGTRGLELFQEPGRKMRKLK